MQEKAVLLVDDDHEFTALLAEYLESESLQVTVANSGQSALEILSQSTFDIAVLDIMMPGMTGLELLQQLRPQHQLPIIMLTGRGGEIDRIVGLEMGADDYLAKPCNPRELLARISAVLRRTQIQGRTGIPNSDSPEAATLPTPQSITSAGLGLNLLTRTASVGDQVLELTSAEFSVLYELLRHAGTIVDKATLTKNVLHRPLTAYDRAIDVHVSRVRQKLAKMLGDDEFIKTVRGSGYLWVHSTQC